MAVGALPGLHAKWWRDPVLRQKDWIVQFDNKEFFGAAMGAAHMVAPIIKDLYGEVEPTQRAMALMAEKLDAMLAWTATRPFTFVHGDFHAKQMFFPTDEGENLRSLIGNSLLSRPVLGMSPALLDSG